MARHLHTHTAHRTAPTTIHNHSPTGNTDLHSPCPVGPASSCVRATQAHSTAPHTLSRHHPDAGGHDTKLRHLSGSPRGAYVTASMRGEGNPDVVKEK